VAAAGPERPSQPAVRPRRTDARPGLAGLEQTLAQVRLLLRGGVPLRRIGQAAQPVEPEQLQEQGRRAAEGSAELRTARLLEAAVLQRRRR
jgi:hypothetical protein